MGDTVMLRNVLDLHVSPHLLDLDFGPRRGDHYLRRRESGQDTITFVERRGRDGTLRVACGVGRSFPDVERLVNTGSGMRITSTLGCDIGRLHERPTLLEWTVSLPEDGPVLASKILDQLDRYAVPFWDDCRSLEQVAAVHSRRSPWFSGGDNARVCVLAAVYAIAGSPERAIAELDDQLQRTLGDRPAASQPLRALKGYLQAMT